MRTTPRQRRTSFVIIDAFVKGESSIKQFVNLVCVLDVVAYLALDDARRMDEPRHVRACVRERPCMRTHLEIEMLPLSPTA